MSDQTKSESAESQGWFARTFGSKLPLETETTRFILVSTLDIFMTYLALRFSAEQRTSSSIGEGNPVADYFIHNWGIRGMVFFKMFMVGFIVILAQLIARKRLTYGRWVLNFGTVLVACVVVYSLSLILKVWTG